MSIWDRHRQGEQGTNWLVPNLLLEGGVHLLCKPAGGGGSLFALWLAGRVAHGLPALGEEVKQRKVLIFDGEGREMETHRRLDLLGIEPTENLDVLGHWDAEPPPGPEKDWLIDYAKDYKPLLIWDSLIAFHPGEEMSSSETRKFTANFCRLANAGATVLVIHHSGKGKSAKSRARGSSDIPANVDMAFWLQKTREEVGLNELFLEHFKSRVPPLPRRRIRFIEWQGFELADTHRQEAAGRDVLEIVSVIVGLSAGIMQKGIVQQAKDKGCKRTEVLKVLENRDVFRLQLGNHNSHHYYLIE